MRVDKSTRKLSVRPAQPSDLDAVAALFHAMDVHYWGAEAPSLCRIKDHVRAHVLRPHGCETIIAEFDAQAVGLATFAILYPAPNLGGQLYMKDLFVVEAARGGGVGRELMRYLAQTAIERGCVRMDWTAEQGNQRALRFYSELGAPIVPEKVYYRLSGTSLEAMANA